MTRTQRTIVLHWRGLVTLCAIVILFGIAWATWHRIDSSDRAYAAAVAEADLRGRHCRWCQGMCGRCVSR